MRAAVTLNATIICVMLASLAAHKIALAQAGSTGGTIGKTDKSVSGGGEAAARPPHNVKPRAERTERRAASTARAESRAAGAAGNADGTWLVSATGRCIPPSQVTFLINDGMITGNGITGQVSRGGSAHGRVTILVLTFDFVGHFGGSAGSGTFVGGDGCPGQWTASKS